jgi:SNF family Na+-dependent transporter
LAAITQVFFSLSVGFAIMIAYGSYLDKKSDIVQNAFIIGIADAVTAFIAGLAVFGALGYEAHIQGVGIADVVRSGPGLTFITYPQIINHLPLPQLFGVLFFVMLLTLAVDSAFSLLEAVTSSVKDKFGWTNKKANLIVGGLSFLLGIPLLTGAGLHWLDIVDHFMNHFGLTLVVLIECIVIAFVVGLPKMRHYLDKISYWRTRKIGLIAFAVAILLITFSMLHINHVQSGKIITALIIIAIIEILFSVLYYKNSGIKEYFEKRFWYLFEYFWDVCVLFATPIGIILMLIFEINARINEPYGDFADRGQEFIFGWMVLILLVVIGILMMKLKGKSHGGIPEEDEVSSLEKPV